MFDSKGWRTGAGPLTGESLVPHNHWGWSEGFGCLGGVGRREGRRDRSVCKHSSQPLPGCLVPGWFLFHGAGCASLVYHTGPQGALLLTPLFQRARSSLQPLLSWKKSSKIQATEIGLGFQTRGCWC